MYVKIQVFSLLTNRLCMNPINRPQSVLFANLRMRLKITLSFYRIAS